MKLMTVLCNPILCAFVPLCLVASVMRRLLRKARTMLSVYNALMVEVRSEIFLWMLATAFPLILMGQEFWQPLLEFISIRLVREGVIDPADEKRLTVTDSVDEAVTAIVDAAASFANSQVLGVAGQRAITEMRKDVQEHVMRLPIRYFDSTKTGVLIARIMSDAEGIRNLVGTGIVQSSYEGRQDVGALLDEAEQPGGPPHAEHQEPGGHRVQGAVLQSCAQAIWIAGLQFPPVLGLRGGTGEHRAIGAHLREDPVGPGVVKLWHLDAPGIFGVFTQVHRRADADLAKVLYGNAAAIWRREAQSA